MKRDMELIRKIAFYIESAREQVFSPSIQIEGFTTEQICYHCELMLDAGLIRVNDNSHLNSDVCEMLIDRLTSKGHDFVDAARSDTLWNKTRKKVIDTVGSVTIDVLLTFLKSQSLEMLGNSSTSNSV